jgi:phospholipid transport system substrate-binding protein
MRLILVKKLFFIFALSTLIPSMLFAGEPTDRLKVASDKIIAIISDPAMKDPAMKEKKDQLVMGIVEGIFNWDEFSRRALAQNWGKRTDSEKKAFIALFSQLVERTYMAKANQYSGGKVEFLDEKIDGDYGNVSTKYITSGGVQIPVDYRVMKKGGAWCVYDVYIEGVSLVNNYRSQFTDILLKSSFDELMKRLKEKVEKGE